MSTTGCVWRTVSLREGLPSLQKGLLPKPSLNDLVHILQKCRLEKDCERALQWHAYVRDRSLETHSLLGNLLVLMLVDCGRINDARQVFDMLLDPNDCAWNCLVTGYVRCGKLQNALTLYNEFRKDVNVFPKTHTFVALLKACAKLNNLEMGTKLHSEVATMGLLNTNLCIGSALINMYGECGSLEKAQQVFDKLPMRNVVSWNVLITAHVKHGKAEQALEFFGQMQEDGIVPNSVTFLGSLKACGSMGAMNKGQEIHSDLERRGCLDQDLAAGNTLVDMYAKCGSLAKAQEVFDRLRVRDVVSWNVLMTGYTEHEHDEEVLECFEQMQMAGFSPNSVTYACSLKACGNLGAVHEGGQIHVEIERKGLVEKDIAIGNTLVVMYAKCGVVARAQQAFENLLVRDIIAWNALIAGFADYGRCKEALACYEQMVSDSVYPDSVTFLSTLKACGGLEDLDIGQNIHAEVERMGLLERNHFLGSALVVMYAKCGLLDRAQEVFENLLIQSVVAWTALILGYTEQGHGEQAIKCFDLMQLAGVSANAVTFVAVLKACCSIGALDHGRDIHREVERIGLLESNLPVGSTLVDMYAKCGLLAKAQQVFDQLPARDAVAWTALVAGYVEHGQAEEALTTFERMLTDGVCPDAVTLVCSLKACGSMGAIEKGIEIHAEIARKGLQERVVVGSMLVDMYSKCGAHAFAQQVFNDLPVKDVVVWNSLMTGYAQLKERAEVFDTFDKMLGEGIRPDPVTFIIVLTASSRAGLYEKSHTYFEAMSKEYGLIPSMEHYNCLVDNLSQEGELGKAIGLIHSNLVAWRSVLGACKSWGNLDFGMQAFEHSMGLCDKAVLYTH